MKPRSGRRRRPNKLDLVETLVVESNAPTGEGVARLADGQVVLVRGALAGEKVVVAASAGQRRARLREVLVASPARVEPSCAVAERCGGCDLMHAGVETQHDIHRSAVMDQLAHQLRVRLPEPSVWAPCDSEGYRSRARLSLSVVAGKVVVGYRGARSHRVVGVDACPVLRSELAPVLKQLSESLEGSLGDGEAQIDLGAGCKPVVDLHWQGELEGGSFPRIESQVDSGNWAGIQVWAEGATRPAVFGDPRPCVLAFDSEDLWIAPGGFSQASHAGGSALAKRVRELVARGPCARIVELFAGSGTLTVAVAPLAEHYLAVEQDEAAVEALRANLAARSLKVRAVAADVGERPISPATDTVLLDPPRSGAFGVMNAIIAARPRQVIYVSCQAATLARDLKPLLAARYTLEQIEIFEIFPHTSHVEVAARLVRG